jgi:hypothetical protein
MAGDPNNPFDRGITYFLYFLIVAFIVIMIGGLIVLILKALGI